LKRYDVLLLVINHFMLHYLNSFCNAEGYPVSTTDCPVKKTRSSADA